MRSQTYARTKLELVRLTGLSRTALYHLLRLPGAPVPRADSRWNVEEVRRFALNSAKKLAGPPERDELQLELTRLKIKRASAQLADFEAEIRAEIEGNVREHFKRAVNIMANRLKLMPRDLATRCDGAGAQQIFKIST